MTLGQVEQWRGMPARLVQHESPIHCPHLPTQECQSVGGIACYCHACESIAADDSTGSMQHMIFSSDNSYSELH